MNISIENKTFITYLAFEKFVIVNILKNERYLIKYLLHDRKLKHSFIFRNFAYKNSDGIKRNFVGNNSNIHYQVGTWFRFTIYFII